MEQNTAARIDLAEAIKLIKAQITASDTARNRDLHQAVGLIVDSMRAFWPLAYPQDGRR